MPTKQTITLEKLIEIAERARADADVNTPVDAARGFFARLCGTIEHTHGDEACARLARALGFDHLVE